jgi:hypothetical protein
MFAAKRGCIPASVALRLVLGDLDVGDLESCAEYQSGQRRFCRTEEDSGASLLSPYEDADAGDSVQERGSCKAVPKYEDYGHPVPFEREPYLSHLAPAEFPSAVFIATQWTIGDIQTFLFKGAG